MDYDDCDLIVGKVKMTSLLITKPFVVKEQVILFTSLGQARGPPLSPEHADWSSMPPHTCLNIMTMTIFSGQ